MNSDLHSKVTSSKGIFFDLFHTLTSCESEWSEGPFTYQALGVTREAWEHQLFESSRFRLAGLERDPQAFITRIARAIDPSITDEVIRFAVANRSNRFVEALGKIPETNITLLMTLRRHRLKLGLISNADCGEVASWDASPLAPLFDSVVFSCQVGHVKPEPEIFLRGLTELAWRPQDCLFVGDGGSQELHAARALGFTTVMVTGIMRELWPDKIEDRAKDADYVIDFPIELLLPERSSETQLRSRIHPSSPTKTSLHPSPNLPCWSQSITSLPVEAK